jgi:hypothetical protein
MPSPRNLLAIMALLFTFLAVSLAAPTTASAVADCYYSSYRPDTEFSSSSSKDQAIACLSKLKSSASPFASLPTVANCGNRNWSMQSPTAGHVGDVPNSECVDLCDACIKGGITNGYRNAQCDVMISGVYGPVCQIFMGAKL